MSPAAAKCRSGIIEPATDVIIHSLHLRCINVVFLQLIPGLAKENVTEMDCNRSCCWTEITKCVCVWTGNKDTFAGLALK